jgi:hypothetical protein
MGQGPANSPLHLVWKDRGGLIKENVWLATADWGGFQHCSSDGDTLIVGDILRATVGSYTRKFVMPSVGVQVDRVNDVIMGTAPANSTILLGYMYTRCCPDYMQQEEIAVDSDGGWSFTDGGSFDNYMAEVEWTSPQGDIVRNSDIAPSVSVTIGKSLIGGTFSPETSASIALRDGNTNALKARALITTDEYGYYRSVFVNNAGQPVAVSVGDRVVGTSLVSDMKFIVRDIPLEVDVATDTVSGRCVSRNGDSISILRSGNQIGGIGYLGTDEDGFFDVWFGDEETLGFDPANIRHGDRVKVTCGTVKGDFVTKSYLVP